MLLDCSRLLASRPPLFEEMLNTAVSKLDQSTLDELFEQKQASLGASVHGLSFVLA